MQTNVSCFFCGTGLFSFASFSVLFFLSSSSFFSRLQIKSSIDQVILIYEQDWPNYKSVGGMWPEHHTH